MWKIKEKQRTRQQIENSKKIYIVDTHPTISIITFKVDSLNKQRKDNFPSK